MLSILKNATPGSTTYYTGNNPEHCAHLKDCTLICNIDFCLDLPGVKTLNVQDPQLEFYKLSSNYKEEYLDFNCMKFIDGSWIHIDAKISSTTTIMPGCTIGNVEIGPSCVIHPGCVIYSKTSIGSGTCIEANSVIGAAGMMGVWDGAERVFLEQLGTTSIGNDCRIGSNVTIVRGSANEESKLGNNVCMAHGTKTGHGCNIADYNHFANNVSLGGSVWTSTGSFFGCGSTISPRCIISAEIILGAGACLINDVHESGVYVGTPAKKIKEIGTSHSGVPYITKLHGTRSI